MPAGPWHAPHIIDFPLPAAASPAKTGDAINMVAATARVSFFIIFVSLYLSELFIAFNDAMLSALARALLQTSLKILNLSGI